MVLSKYALNAPEYDNGGVPQLQDTVLVIQPRSQFYRNTGVVSRLTERRVYVTLRITPDKQLVRLFSATSLALTVDATLDPNQPDAVLSKQQLAASNQPPPKDTEDSEYMDLERSTAVEVEELIRAKLKDIPRKRRPRLIIRILRRLIFRNASRYFEGELDEPRRP